MPRQDEPYFLDGHSSVATSVSFHPKEQHTFCSAGLDGKLNFCTALEPEIVRTTSLANTAGVRYINSIKYNQDGTRVFATVYRRFSVIDVETSQPVQHYDNVSYAAKERVPIAADPTNPNIGMCITLNGRGLVTLDARLPQPAYFAMDIHPCIIHDFAYLKPDWPIGPKGESTLVSLSRDGLCKFTNREGLEIQRFDTQHRSYCIEPTPDDYLHSDEEQVESHILIGGEKLSCYRPAKPAKEPLLVTSAFNRKPMYKICYLSSCFLFYTISCDEAVRLYRRRGHQHEYVKEMYTHNDVIMDVDISPVDEYIVTCSRDGQICVLRLGNPSRGASQYYEYA